jgi:MIP family channel proteins
MERSAAGAVAVDQRGPAAYIAEFIGTFVLVFIVTSAVVLFVTPGGGGGSDFAVVGLVHAFVLFMLVMTIGSVSGSHLNPAVTLGLTALRKIRVTDAAVYILLQLSGGVAGALMTKFIIADNVVDPATPAGGVAAAASASPEVGTPQLNDALVGGAAQGAVLEGLGTFFLVWAITAVAVNPRAARDWAGWVIGATLGFIVMVGGPLTGGSFNPARWFGPALVSGTWDDAWIYIIGPLVGGVLGAVTYWYLFVEGRLGAVALPGAGPAGLRQDVPPAERR